MVITEAQRRDMLLRLQVVHDRQIGCPSCTSTCSYACPPGPIAEHCSFCLLRSVMATLEK